MPLLAPPPGWRAAWTVLDTNAADGVQLAALWEHWCQLGSAAPSLHYVLLGCTPTAEPLPLAPQHWQEPLRLACAPWKSGFARVLLEHGRVSLTLCPGTILDGLRTLHLAADVVWARAPLLDWQASWMARCCKADAAVCLALDAKDDVHATQRQLQAVGFVLEPATNPTPGLLHGRLQVRWRRPRTRHAVPRAPEPGSAHCAVIGAGLSGAALAQVLALRGWRVSVLEQSAAPAQAASGLPVALAAPYASRDDNPLSRLTHAGLLLLRQHAQSLLRKHQDWSPCGALERRGNAPPRWHADALWLRPQSLVRAWLATPGVVMLGHMAVEALQAHPTGWHAHTRDGALLGPYTHVVVCNAMDAPRLLLAHARQDAVRTQLAALHGVHGTLSSGRYLESIDGLPRHPIHGHGCFLPTLADDVGHGWCLGATFETDPNACADLAAQHAANLAHLPYLLPNNGLGALLMDVLARSPHQTWSATRCVSRDRLPLVGAVDLDRAPGLWMCVGMGARGLTLAPLCAQLLAARLCAEPWPLPRALAQCLDSQRQPHPARPQRQRQRQRYQRDSKQSNTHEG